jgi:hypothetical protein
MVEVFVSTEVAGPQIFDVQRTNKRGIDRHQANLAFVTIEPMFHLGLLFGHSIGYSPIRHAVIDLAEGT